jgi:signal transduction histidine kinase
MPADAEAEVLALRTVLRDLVALSAIPAAWVGREPTAVAAGLADALLELLRLDFVHVRLGVPGVAGVADAARGAGWETFPGWLEGQLSERGGFLTREIVPDVDGDGGRRRAVVMPIGVNAEGGMVAAACDRADFPSTGDQLLLSLAANHAAAVFQNVRLNEHHAQMWFLESLDRIDRAMQGTSDLDLTMGDVLDAVLATFSCDRACLSRTCDPGGFQSAYPRDPDAFTPGDGDVLHQVFVERTRPEYPGAKALDADLLSDPGAADVSQIALESNGPVRLGLETGHAVPAQLAERFAVKSIIAMAVYPKLDKPYLFGLHQCSYRRVWTLQEERLFHEIGRRLADAIDTVLMFRDLRESERKLERSRAELAASRARIVTAADQARSRIERDLHDGVQQRLVSLLLAQRTALAMASPERTELQARLAEMGEGLEGALKELQEIARGIHPAILTDGGLTPALKTLARRSAVPVQLAARIDSRLPESVEVAAYYVVSEALTNAAKHARASVVRVTAEVLDGILELSVCDDGVGGADPARGSGLVGLTDRVDALGGVIEVTSRAGQGTTLRVTLPTSPIS